LPYSNPAIADFCTATALFRVRQGPELAVSLRVGAATRRIEPPPRFFPYEFATFSTPPLVFTCRSLHWSRRSPHRSARTAHRFIRSRDSPPWRGDGSCQPSDRQRQAIHRTHHPLGRTAPPIHSHVSRANRSTAPILIFHRGHNTALAGHSAFRLWQIGVLAARLNRLGCQLASLAARPTHSLGRDAEHPALPRRRSSPRKQAADPCSAAQKLLSGL
jgi:hypothetical protein